MFIKIGNFIINSDNILRIWKDDMGVDLDFNVHDEGNAEPFSMRITVHDPYHPEALAAYEWFCKSALRFDNDTSANVFHFDNGDGTIGQMQITNDAPATSLGNSGEWHHTSDGTEFPTVYNDAYSFTLESFAESLNLHKILRQYASEISTLQRDLGIAIETRMSAEAKLAECEHAHDEASKQRDAATELYNGKHERIAELKQRAERLSDWDLEHFADKLYKPQPHPSELERLALAFASRVNRYWNPILSELAHEAPDEHKANVAWAMLFREERELMERDYQAYKVSLEVTAQKSALEPHILIGVFDAYELRRAVKFVRKGKNRIVVEVGWRGITIYDENASPEERDETEMYVYSRTDSAQGWDFVVDASLLSYTGKYSGLLDIEPEGEVTIEIIGDKLWLTGKNWTAAIKQWELYIP